MQSSSQGAVSLNCAMQDNTSVFSGAAAEDDYKMKADTGAIDDHLILAAPEKRNSTHPRQDLVQVEVKAADLAARKVVEA